MLSSEYINNFLENNLSIDFPEIFISKNLQISEQILLGPGFLTQDLDKNFSLKIFSSSDDSKKIINNETKIGDFIPEEEYLKITCKDLTGNSWIAIVDDVSIKSCKKNIITCKFKNIIFEDQYNERKDHINETKIFYFKNKIKIPCDIRTETKKIIENIEHTSSVRYNIKKISINNLNFIFEKSSDDYLIITVTSIDNLFSPAIELRISEALQFSLGKNIRWEVYQVIKADIEQIKFYPQELTKTEISPINQDCYPNDFWNLFEKYFKYILKDNNQVIHPLTIFSSRIYRFLETTIEVQLLVITTSLEGLIKNFFDNINISDTNGEKKQEKDNIKRTIELIKTSTINEEFQTRVINCLNNFSSKRPVDVLHELKNEKFITEDMIDAWKKSRHKLAHGDFIQEDYTTYSNYYFKLLTLSNILVFRVIGYAGSYRNFSKNGWPNEKFDFLRD
ncbi:MAG: hypothetical protein ACD_79C00629G0001 [uncultured bacterium]|nr:MAG: hypothetical protein ACD_79C00629G0001 [uncultured bacterium]